MTLTRLAVAVLATVPLLTLSARVAPKPGVDWPSFRGIDASGVSEGPETPTTFAPDKAAWKTAISGLGLSSPIVWGDLLCVSTAISGQKDAGLRIGPYGDIASVADDTPHEWKVICLNKRDGKVAWERTAHKGVPKVKRHTKSTHANSTLATDGTHLAAIFGSEGLYVYDLKGKLLWQKDLGVLDAGFFRVPDAQWEYGSSPIIHDGRLIIVADVQKDSFLASFDVKTGKELWRTPRADVPTWGSPAVVTSNGRSQVVVNGWRHIGGYDLQTGKEIWKMSATGDIPVPTPVYGHGLIFLTSAHGPGSPVYAIKPTATGDITLPADATSNEHIAWSLPKDGAYMATPLVYGDHLYVVRSSGVLNVFNAKTGERAYQQRLAAGAFTASPVANNGRIYVASEDGDIYVVKTGPSYELLTVNKMEAPVLATPAISEGRLYVRTRDHVMAFGAPAALPQSFAPAERVPFDSSVTTGTLPNGMRYYIRKNARPEKRVELQLAVKAGSVDEAADQQGLAHFLEHMAFNGTRRFKPGELIKTFETTGARLGPHLNAYTSFDETVYTFHLPTDAAGLVEKGVQALADFAGGMTLDPKEIDKERGVVIEEWRGRLGAGSRLTDLQVPVLFYKSKYAERLPIGKPEIIKSAPPERVRAFYTQWYRPDRMAVVVVGDIDPEQMLVLIRKEMGALPKPSTPATARTYDVPLHPETLFKVATDPEAQGSSISILRKRKRGSDDTVGDYRESLVHQLVYRMLNERFSELARKPDAAFLGAGAGGGGLSPTTEMFSLNASVQHGRTEAGLAALAVEANRVKQHGFGPAELDRAKKTLLAFFERANNERDKSESDSYASEYVSHFLLGEPSPGIAYEYALAKAVVPAITLDDVTAAARKLLADDSRVIIAISPQKADVATPTEDQLRASLTKAEAVAVTAWADATGGKAILETIPDPGAVKDRRELPELGVTVVRYANGVEAWFKPTDFKNDEVVFSFVSPGGASLASPEKYIEAQVAPTYIGFSGAGGHSATDLQRLLAGKPTVRAMPSIGPTSHGISGSSGPADLETALQLLYIRFTKPGDDPQQFELLKKQFEAAYANRANNPTAMFGDKLGLVNTSGHYTAQPVTVERLSKLDRAAIVSFYRERFSNAADFTFFMVGTFKLDEAIPLVGRYVGTLPSTVKGTAKFKDLGIKFPAATERAVVEKGKEPKALTVLSFAADPSPDAEEQARLAAATEVLEIAMRDILREELGETYNVSVGLSQPLPQRGAGHIRVQFGGAPDKVDRMVERTLQEVKRLQQEGPSADLTTRAKESARREDETGRKQNGYWLGRLQMSKLLERDPMLILERQKRIDAITPAILHEMFKKYFPLDRHTVVTLVPEKGGV